MSEAKVYQNALDPGTTLNEYELISVLGVGGFGITYLARDRNLEKQVAIKEYLPGDLALRALDGSVVPVSTDHRYDYQWGLERFIQEARTLARFSHPHIVHVNRYFEANGTGYMVMDYEEGESLSQLLKRKPFPPEEDLRRIVLPLLDGLAAVHAAKFLHRDIKPSNIFIRSDGTPILLDFGAARAHGGGTRALTAVLTPGYAPLEQYSLEGRQGPWSDIYAMGGVLFRTVTNHNPPDAVSRLQKDTVADSLAVVHGRYSAPMLRAIEWALAVNTELRPQRIADWRAAFEAQAAQADPVAAAQPSAVATTVRVAPGPSSAPGRRTARPAADHGAAWRRIGWAGAGLVAILLALGWHQRRAEAPPPAAAVVQPDRRVAAPTTVQGADVPALRPAQVDTLPAREFAPEADPRERPARPDGGSLIPDLARERVSAEFRGADRDGDGYLSPAEVEGRFPLIAREFSRIDRDGDRRISLDEFTELRRLQVEARKASPR